MQERSPPQFGYLGYQNWGLKIKNKNVQIYTWPCLAAHWTNHMHAQIRAHTSAVWWTESCATNPQSQLALNLGKCKPMNTAMAGSLPGSSDAVVAAGVTSDHLGLWEGQPAEPPVPELVDLHPRLLRRVHPRPRPAAALADGTDRVDAGIARRRCRGRTTGAARLAPILLALCPHRAVGAGGAPLLQLAVVQVPDAVRLPRRRRDAWPDHPPPLAGGEPGHAPPARRVRRLDEGQREAAHHGARAAAQRHAARHRRRAARPARLGGGAASRRLAALRRNGEPVRPRRRHRHLVHGRECGMSRYSIGSTGNDRWAQSYSLSATKNKPERVM